MYQLSCNARVNLYHGFYYFFWKVIQAHNSSISSYFLQCLSYTHDVTEHDKLVISQRGSSMKSVIPLPSTYPNVPLASLKATEFSAPALQGPVRPFNLLAATVATDDEYA